MTTTIELPVIEMNKSKSRTIYWLTLFTTVLMYIVLIIVFNDKNNLIGRLFLISMLAFVIGIFFLKKSHSQKGFLIINTDSIIYSTETKTETFLTREISEISFLYDGYSGKPESSNLQIGRASCRERV